MGAVGLGVETATAGRSVVDAAGTEELEEAAGSGSTSFGLLGLGIAGPTGKGDLRPSLRGRLSLLRSWFAEMTIHHPR